MTTLHRPATAAKDWDGDPAEEVTLSLEYVIELGVNVPSLTSCRIDHEANTITIARGRLREAIKKGRDPSMRRKDWKWVYGSDVS